MKNALDVLLINFSPKNAFLFLGEVWRGVINHISEYLSRLIFTCKGLNTHPYNEYSN